MHADLLLRPHPFAEEPGIYPVRAGQTLLAMLREGAQAADLRETLRVEIGGHEVPRHLWARVTPKAGVPIVVTAMPAGGSARKLVRTVLLVALTVFTGGMAAAGWTAFGLSAATTAALVGFVGSLAINALLPPPTPKLGGGGGEAPGRWLALTGSSNRANPYGAIPLVIGKSKIFPPHAALPYSEVLGDTVYQRLMFDLGHGDIEVSEIKIGETAIDSFDEVEYEVTTTPTLYTSDVSETAVSAVMADSDQETRTTSANVDEISLDIVFPQGLFGLSTSGKTITATADLTVEYRLNGTADPWVEVPITTPEAGAAPTRTSGLLVGALLTAASVPVTGGKDRKPFAVSVAWGVPQGQYDVRVTRGTTDWNGAATGSRVGEDATWTVLRSIRHTNPSTTGTNKLCLRIKSSEQLNGTLDTLNCVVTQKVPVWDVSEVWWPASDTQNPAWVYAWLLKGAGGAFATEIDDSRIDLDSLLAFADYCTTHGFEARGVLESQQTMGEFLREFLACALATPTLRDGKYGVLFDDGSTTPTTMFSPMNSRGFSASRPFINMPHALRVEFRNPDAYWETDAILVLADGYSFNGVDARGDASADPEPSLIETLTLRYSCDAFSAWKIARYHLAQGKYRTTQYAFETDIANLSVTRGDCVAMQHDVTEWGTGAGRIVSLSGTTMVLDNRIVTEEGGSYSVRIQASDGSMEVIACTPHSVETETFVLDSEPTDAAVGDLAILGETGSETMTLYVTGIQPGSDLSARLSAVAYSAEIAGYWADPPATITSEITGTTYRDGPAEPDVDVTTDTDNDDDDDAGIHEPVVHIRIGGPGGFIRVPEMGAPR